MKHIDRVPGQSLRPNDEKIGRELHLSPKTAIAALELISYRYSHEPAGLRDACAHGHGAIENLVDLPNECLTSS